MNSLPSAQRFAVLMDASAIFFAVRNLYEDHQLDYSKLAELLVEKTGVQVTEPNHQKKQDLFLPDQIWGMWTSFHAQNTGQVRFLEYAEHTLGWAVRRVDPTDSYIIDPQTTLGISKPADGGMSRAVNRLIRFDAGIAYSIGRVADSHQIVLISDSYALAEPLVRSAVARRDKRRSSGLKADNIRNYIAFFGRLLDPRWLGLLRGKAGEHIEFIDLDDYSDRLFGSKKSVAKDLWEDNFPIR